jgi:hypothetical protein
MIYERVTSYKLFAQSYNGDALQYNKKLSNRYMILIYSYLLYHIMKLRENISTKGGLSL